MSRCCWPSRCTRSQSIKKSSPYLFSVAGIKTLEALDKPSHEVHLGFKLRVYGNYVMDFALIENMITLDNSPDFGVHIGLSRRF